MKPFSILLLRVLSLYLVLTALFSFLPILFSSSRTQVFEAELFPILIASLLLPLVGGIVLWILAPWVSDRIHRYDEIEGSQSPINDSGLVSAGLFLIGMFLLVRNIAYLVGNYNVSKSVDFGAIFVVVVSLLLIVGNGFFTKIYKKIRYFGIDT
jgi:hypothetical protein